MKKYIVLTPDLKPEEDIAVRTKLAYYARKMRTIMRMRGDDIEADPSLEGGDKYYYLDQINEFLDGQIERNKKLWSKEGNE